MSKVSSIPQVFLDANIVIRSGKPPGGAEFERVADLVNAGIILVLTTDLTITEVAKQHAGNDYDVIKEIGRPHFRKLVEDAVGTKIATITKAELWEAMMAKYTAAVSAMFKRLNATQLAIDDVKASLVFDSYANNTGLFSGEGKKDQFPDAFIFEALKAWAAKKGSVVIVSDDGDFAGPAKNEKNIEVVKSLPELFKKLGYEIDAPQVSAFLEEEVEELQARLGDELNDWGLQGDVEDSEISDIEVAGLEIGKFTAFKPVNEGDSILAVGTVEALVKFDFSHPDWDTASYDSEDKVLLPWDEVSGEKEVEMKIDVSISISVGEHGEPEEIEMVNMRNSRFQFVELHPYDTYK